MSSIVKTNDELLEAHGFGAAAENSDPFNATESAILSVLELIQSVSQRSAREAWTRKKWYHSSDLEIPDRLAQLVVTRNAGSITEVTEIIRATADNMRTSHRVLSFTIQKKAVALDKAAADINKIIEALESSNKKRLELEDRVKDLEFQLEVMQNYALAIQRAAVDATVSNTRDYPDLGHYYHELKKAASTMTLPSHPAINAEVDKALALFVNLSLLGCSLVDAIATWYSLVYQTKSARRVISVDAALVHNWRHATKTLRRLCVKRKEPVPPYIKSVFTLLLHEFEPDAPMNVIDPIRMILALSWAGQALTGDDVNVLIDDMGEAALEHLALWRHQRVTLWVSSRADHKRYLLERHRLSPITDNLRPVRVSDHKSSPNNNQ